MAGLRTQAGINFHTRFSLSVRATLSNLWFGLLFMLSILRCSYARSAQISIRVLDYYGRETLEKNHSLGSLTPGCHNVTIFSFHRKQMERNRDPQTIVIAFD